MDLDRELARWGPQGTARCASLAEAEHYCRELAQSHYENFSVVSWLFPRHLWQHLCNVYAYCRWADDLADETNEASESLALLDWWQRQLDELHQAAARPQHPVFIALRETIQAKQLSLQPFHDLLVAFRQDQTQRRYESWEALQEYCRHSANPVGAIVLQLGGAASEENLQRSNEICTGLQLINFCQDVSRDFAKGRIYLPEDERAQFNWTDERFTQQSSAKTPPDASFQQMLGAQVDRAEALLRRGSVLSTHCGRDLAFPVRTFVRGGLAIAAAIRRQNYDVWTRRPVIGRGRRVAILLRSWLNL